MSVLKRTQQLPFAENFRELLVYQKARQLTLNIFRLSARFPREETYSLTDQVRRASRSIGAQIAEAWAKRRYEKHFVSKLIDANGEQQETQQWIEVAVDCGYVNEDQSRLLIEKCVEIGRLLGSMIAKSDLFCDSPLRTVRELTTDYFVDPVECE